MPQSRDYWKILGAFELGSMRLPSYATSSLEPQTEQPVRDFHAHLDACERCRELPFHLCPVGRRLLVRAGQEGN